MSVERYATDQEDRSRNTRLPFAYDDDDTHTHGQDVELSINGLRPSHHFHHHIRRVRAHHRLSPLRLRSAMPTVSFSVLTSQDQNINNTPPLLHQQLRTWHSRRQADDTGPNAGSSSSESPNVATPSTIPTPATSSSPPSSLSSGISDSVTATSTSSEEVSTSTSNSSSDQTRTDASTGESASPTLSVDSSSSSESTTATTDAPSSTSSSSAATTTSSMDSLTSVISSLTTELSSTSLPFASLTTTSSSSISSSTSSSPTDTTTTETSTSLSTPATSSGASTTTSRTSVSETSSTRLTSSIILTQPTSTSESTLDSISITSISRTVTSTSTVNTATIINNASSSSDLKTITSTFVTTRSGSPTTMTTVIVGPSGSLNASDGNNRGLPKGAIAAITIVSVIAVAAVALWLFFAFLRRKGRGPRSGPLFLGSGSSRTISESTSSTRPLNYGGTGLGRINSSGFGMRTSPLHDEDADIEGPQHTGSIQSHQWGGSAESTSGMLPVMRESESGFPSAGAGSDTRQSYIPEWWSDRARMEALGANLARLRGGDGVYSYSNSTGTTPEALTAMRDREMGLLDAAGLSSGFGSQGRNIVLANTPTGMPEMQQTRSPAQRPMLTFAPDPVITPRRNSIPLEKVYATEMGERSPEASSPGPVSPNRGILRTNPEESEPGLRPVSPPGAMMEKRSSLRRNNSTTQSPRPSSLPPSSWPYFDTGKEHERERSISPVEPDERFLGRTRSRSSNELSSSGHGHPNYGFGGFAVTSSQGHGSATHEDGNERGYMSGSGSSSGHHGSGSQSHSNSHSLGGHSRESAFAASAIALASRKESTKSSKRASTGSEGLLMRTKESLKERLRRSSVIGGERIQRRSSLIDSTRPIAPVSQLVMTKPLPQPPRSSTLPASLASLLPPATSQYADPIPRVTSASSISRSLAPSAISLPPLSRSGAQSFAHAQGSQLAAILASPSPVETPEGVPDGILDPALANRLREIHGSGRADSSGSLRLRDHEDYSRPIHALINNPHYSSSTVASVYSQRTERVRTPPPVFEDYDLQVRQHTYSPPSPTSATPTHARFGSRS